MIDEKTLLDLRQKMPLGYAKKVQAAYRELTGNGISRWTISRFFDGKAYSEDVHSAVLNVAIAQQALQQKTKEVINA